jgi:hypothetical protein
MSYKISQAYCWYNEGSQIVKMYFISEIPFTFDELPDGHLYDKDLKELADKQRRFEPDDLYKNSFYLMEEKAHPLLFPMDLENPEDLPEDILEFDVEDLV